MGCGGCGCVRGNGRRGRRRRAGDAGERERGLVVYPDDGPDVRARKAEAESQRRSELAALHAQVGNDSKATEHAEWAEILEREADAWRNVARENRPVVRVVTAAPTMRVVYHSARIRTPRTRRMYSVARGPSSRRRRSGLVRSGRSPDRESDSEADLANPRGARGAGGRVTAPRPELGEVLAHVHPGSVIDVRVPSGFTDAHPDNPIGLSVVRHLRAARRRVGASDDLPLTDATIQAVAAKLGHAVGIKRCSAIRRRLSQAGVIVAVGSYARHGVVGDHRVSLWRAQQSPGSLPASVRKRPPVKSRRRRLAWFETVLGSLDARPPPGMTKDKARRMRSLDDRFAPGSAPA